jgi:hypothetical protein
MMDSHSRRSESTDHTSNTPPKMRYPHPSMALSCFETELSDSSKLASLRDSEHYSIRLCEDPPRTFQRPVSDCSTMEGDLGKNLPSSSDNSMALNPSRWHMVIDKDRCPSNSHSSPLKRFTISTNSAIQKKVTSHNRWSSEVGVHEETETTIRWSATEADRKRNWTSQQQQPRQQEQQERLNRPTRKVSGYKSSRTSDAFSANVAPTDATTIPVPSVIAVETWPICFPSLLQAAGPGKAVRCRSFDEIPTLPQRQQSSTSLGTIDDYWFSSPTSI